MSNHLTFLDKDIEFNFILGHMYDAFEDATIDWYIGFCDQFPRFTPQPALLSFLFAKNDLSIDFEGNYIMPHETGLSWIIGSVIEEMNPEAMIDNATMLDMSVAEIVAFEEDLKLMLEMHQLVYVDENNKLRNGAITEVW